MLKIVVDTNIWIRALLRGRATIPVLQAWQAGKFQVVVSESLLHELDKVWQQPC
ncbi:MAG: PIN domain-containing protein [candidate division KSB1 bacterium]|nr:PIN domain-containing protein [candidate division KSB1 bacterium]